MVMQPNPTLPPLRHAVVDHLCLPPNRICLALPLFVSLLLFPFRPLHFPKIIFRSSKQNFRSVNNVNISCHTILGMLKFLKYFNFPHNHQSFGKKNLASIVRWKWVVNVLFMPSCFMDWTIPKLHVKSVKWRKRHFPLWRSLFGYFTT